MHVGLDVLPHNRPISSCLCPSVHQIATSIMLSSSPVAWQFGSRGPPDPWGGQAWTKAGRRRKRGGQAKRRRARGPGPPAPYATGLLSRGGIDQVWHFVTGGVVRALCNAVDNIIIILYARCFDRFRRIAYARWFMPSSPVELITATASFTDLIHIFSTGFNPCWILLLAWFWT